MVQMWTQGALEFFVINDGTREGLPLKQLLVDPGDADLLGIDTMPASYNCLLVRGEDRVVLIDTGWGPGRAPGLGLLPERLASIGIEPADVTDVLATHVHGDHIGYHARDGAPAFPSARYVLSRADLAWLDRRTDERGVAQRAMLDPVRDRIEHVEEAKLPLGIEAIFTPGHTPGHHCYRVDGVLNVGDVILVEPGLAHPDVRMTFDADVEKAARTRREVFARAARSGDTVVAFHLPEAVGTIVSDGDAWRWKPR